MSDNREAKDKVKLSAYIDWRQLDIVQYAAVKYGWCFAWC